MIAAREPAAVTVYQLRITLRDVSPLVWRRLLVRSDTTIAQLRDIVQIAMGWEDVHLHQFRIHGKAYGVYRGGGFTFVDNPRQVQLAAFRLRAGERFLYEYDFGDLWRHDIRLEQVLPVDEHRSYPSCIGGHGDCPPEDCGGPAGYAEFLRERNSWLAVSDVHEALAVLAERVGDWRHGGPRPTGDDEEFSEALEQVSDWLEDAPTAFNRRQVNTALREKREEWRCTSASR
jgi:hypothetical protein